MLDLPLAHGGARARAPLRSARRRPRPAARSGSPAIATAAPPARDRAAAARSRKRRSEAGAACSRRSTDRARRAHVPGRLSLSAVGVRPPARADRRRALRRRRPLRQSRRARRGRAAGGARRARDRSCSTATSTGSTPSRTGSPRSRDGVARHPRSAAMSRPRSRGRDDIGAGCGCAYPASVDEDVVRRSNEILTDLRRTAASLPGARARGWPRCRCTSSREVGGLRDRHRARRRDRARRLVASRTTRSIDAGMPALARRDPPGRARRRLRLDPHLSRRAARLSSAAPAALTVINNGAAGMPNFSGIAVRPGLAHRRPRPSPHRPLYGLERDGVHIDAIPIAYDHDAFLERFLARWPDGLGGACVLSPSESCRARPTRSRRRGRRVAA